MTISPLKMQKMLRTYGKQLVYARRLARIKRSLSLANGQLDVMRAREHKRQQMIERVAKEIVDNLLVTGAENPLVDEIRIDLEREFDEVFLFEYPFMEQDLQIYRHTEEGPVKLDMNETNQVLKKLWEITLSKVNETML